MVLAKDQQNANKVVTVKLLRKSISSAADFMTEFMTNAEKLKKASCENFARVIDAGSWKGYGYLASNIGPCETLRFAGQHPLPEAKLSRSACRSPARSWPSEVRRFILTSSPKRPLRPQKQDLHPQRIRFY